MNFTKYSCIAQLLEQGKGLFLKSYLLIIALSICSLKHQAQNSNTLFTLMESTHTGIDFENTIIDTKDHNILIYSNYYGGAGVGVGDLDNDGLQDLVFAGNLENDKFFRNLGDLKFQDVTEASGIHSNGGWSSGVLIADVNNDGWLDVYICRELYDNQPELRKNQLFINQGKAGKKQFPTFVESAAAYGLDDDSRTRHATFLDYNKDGYIDLFLLNQPPNPGNFSELYGTKPGPEFAPKLYRNNGNETFTDVTAQAGVGKAGYPNSVTASDFNNDGWTDLYVANDFESPDFLYYNNGDGTFTNGLEKSTNHISYFSMGVDAADINNDGRLDLMVLDMVAEDNYRLKANMSGMDPDNFWKVVSNGGYYQYMFNTLQINQGAVSKEMPFFSDIAQLATVSSTDWSWSNLIADFDNDGYKDIHVTNGLLRDIRNTDADKKFSNYVDEVAYDWIDKNPNAGEISIWEILDLDEALKIVPSQKLANYAYKNNGDLTFSKVTAEWGLDQPTFSNGSAYADLDNDGDLDLVINNVNEKAFLYRNNSEISGNNHYLRVKLTNKKSNQSIFGAKIQLSQQDQSQWYEFTNVRGMYSTSENVAHFGLGAETTIKELVVTWPDGNISRHKQLGVDQEIIIDYQQAVESKVSPSPSVTYFSDFEGLQPVHKENTFDDFEKQVLLPHKMSQFGPALAVADINGDGYSDFFIGGAKGQRGKLVLQDKKGNFAELDSSSLLADKDQEDVDATFFDSDNDGDIDLYVVSGGNEWEPGNSNYQDRLYLNDGTGRFERSPGLPELTESGSCVRPFDYDNDGDLDLFIGGRHVPWSYPSPADSRILENRNGQFTDVTGNIAPDLNQLGMVTDAVWTDLDSNGFTDLVVVGEWMPITIISYDGKKFSNLTRKKGIRNSEGWWYSIAAADMDQDGDEDLIVGNLGLNYKYRATAAEPFEVFYSDFDENGQKDIVLSYYNFGDRYPLRGRSCSAQQVPDIKYDFPTYTQFASANLLDVYGLDKLKPALHYEAKTFASAFIENQGSGELKMFDLPNEAQVSSVNDILVADVNKDGHKDLILAGNLFTAEVETPRNDAGVGLLLLGNGQNNFKPVPAAKSGLMLPYDVKRMALLPTHNSNLVLFGVNDGPMEFLLINKHGGF